MNSEGKNDYRKKKNLFILKVIFITLALNIAILLYGGYMFRNEQESIKYMGYTEYDLNKRKLDYLIQIYDVYIPEYKNAPLTFFTDNMYNPNKDKYELVKGESCEEQIEKINSLLYDDNDRYGRYDNVREKIAEYGFDENNPITSDWVIAHPNEALEMLAAPGGSVYYVVAEYDRYGIIEYWTEYGY